ncbi:MAG TPA: peptidoglycan recognition family protein [Planctomycetota bacterium]|nr:peptidoglycan recognition family protein [Planctomycetota bacterium]
MDQNRRNFLTLLGLGAIAMAGCNTMSDRGYRYVGSTSPNPPKGNGSTATNPGIGEDPATPAHSSYQPIKWPTPVAAVAAADDTILDHAISRDVWADAGPIADRLNPMQTPWRITLHHSGVLCDADSRDGVIQVLRGFRREHIQRFSAGDIGYHYIIDRQGNLWHGRDLKYQGAHVKDHNEGNIGVMIMGNFEDQDPTRAQLDTANHVLPALMKRYKVELDHVRSHRELMPTECPGRILQAAFDGMRDRRFA